MSFCRNCKYWDRSKQNLRHESALCTKHKIGIGASINLVPMPKGHPFHTHEAFGCNSFESAPKQPKAQPPKPEPELDHQAGDNPVVQELVKKMGWTKKNAAKKKTARKK